MKTSEASYILEHLFVTLYKRTTILRTKKGIKIKAKYNFSSLRSFCCFNRTLSFISDALNLTKKQRKNIKNKFAMTIFLHRNLRSFNDRCSRISRSRISPCHSSKMVFFREGRGVSAPPGEPPRCRCQNQEKWGQKSRHEKMMSK